MVGFLSIRSFFIKLLATRFEKICHHNLIMLRERPRENCRYVTQTLFNLDPHECILTQKTVQTEHFIWSSCLVLLKQSKTHMYLFTLTFHSGRSAKGCVFQQSYEWQHSASPFKPSKKILWVFDDITLLNEQDKENEDRSQYIRLKNKQSKRKNWKN